MSAPRLHQQTRRYCEVFHTAFYVITLQVIGGNFIGGNFNDLREPSAVML